MNWNRHSEIKEDQHAFLSPSQSSWLRYDREKLINIYLAKKAAEQGTLDHLCAQMMINGNHKAPRNHQSFNMYVNDAIGYKMRTEQVLKYSQFCYGRTDAIVFDNKLLRIHDLKTGKTPASMDQLLVYAGLFCLEYDIKPDEINYELRIYQNDDIKVLTPSVDQIVPVVDKIISSDKILQEIEQGGLFNV